MNKGDNLKLVFVRHGESEANLGLVSDNPASIPLTASGIEQAKSLARCWDNAPDLIVVSPYLRTQQTAEPTISRFSDTKIITWQIHEFTYLCPDDWHGTTTKDRKNAVVDYWECCNPDYVDGSGAESFNQLIDRVDKTIDAVKEIENNSFVILFTHAIFMKAVKWRLLAKPKQKQHMRDFKRFHNQFEISNCELLKVLSKGGNISMSHLS